MFWMAAFIYELQISLMAGPDTDQNIRFVLFSEMATETALPIVNRFHVLTSCHPAKGRFSPSFLITLVRNPARVNHNRFRPNSALGPAIIAEI
jgi:hypothetical protein